MRIVLMMVDGESPFVSGMNVMMMFVCTTMQYEANDIPMPCHAAGPYCPDPAGDPVGTGGSGVAVTHNTSK